MMPLLWPTRVSGNPKNPAVLFIHGFLGSGADWLSTIEALQSQYYCIAPDLPGHGGNLQQKHFSVPLTLTNIAAGLNTILNQLGVQQTTVVGYSMGGRVALHFALNHSEKLTGLILENTSPGITDETERAKRLAQDQDRATAIQSDLSYFIDRWYQAPLFASLSNHPDRFATLKTTRKQNDPQWVAQAIVDLSPGLQPDLWSSLLAISQPTLLISGNLDLKYSEVMSRIHQALPNSQLISIPMAGHYAHFEQPEIFNKHLQSFLTELE